jgi:hypothetical protein
LRCKLVWVCDPHLVFGLVFLQVWELKKMMSNFMKKLNEFQVKDLVGDCVENYERFTDKIKTLKNLT